ncbi:MFS transporter [Homoserinimonas sp. A520]
MTAMFRSLGVFNYRVWFIGALMSNIGTWMQRTAQDWIVLTELTEHDAAAVGITMALQMGPQLFLMPVSGLIADRVNVRRMLMVTQSTMGALAVGLGLIVVLGVAQLWHVYLFALLLGITAAIDAPIRQTFVAELVSKKYLTNAVSLNSVSFHTARMIGPAVAGGLTVLVGAGPVFLINALTFIATLVALLMIRVRDLGLQPRASRAKGQIRAGFRYVLGRPPIIVIMIMVSLIGTFGLNFSIYISTMATIEFHRGAGEFGFLSSVMAIGSVAGALMSARRERPRLRVIFSSAFFFAAACLIAAVMPTLELFAVALMLVGLTSLSFMTTANAFVQTTVKPAMRGRVMALYLAIFVGGTPIGAPLAGWVVNQFGPRWGLGVAVAAGLLAASVCMFWMVRYQNLRVRVHKGRRPLRVSYGHHTNRALATQEIAIVEAEAQRS